MCGALQQFIRRSLLRAHGEESVPRGVLIQSAPVTRLFQKPLESLHRFIEVGLAVYNHAVSTDFSLVCTTPGNRRVCRTLPGLTHQISAAEVSIASTEIRKLT